MAQNGSAATKIWILGATGRIGRGVAERLAERHIPIVLVGRDRAHLGEVAASVGGGPEILKAASIEKIVSEIVEHRPRVVVNTVGPFSETGVRIARACMPGGRYLDLANDLVAVPALLGLHDQAVAAGSALITGAGFGFAATEAVVAGLCEDRSVPAAVRLDALPSVEMQAGPVGEALAASIIETLHFGSRRYEDNRLVRGRLGGDLERVTLPGGETVRSGGVPLGDLHAAWLASGAPVVIAASSGAPTSAPVRAILPLASALLSLGPLRRLMTRRLGATNMKAKPRPREHSWGRAVIDWPDGTRLEGWSRTGDAMSFTAAIAAAAAARLAQDDVPPGAFTPVGAFGPDIATDAGAELILG